MTMTTSARNWTRLYRSLSERWRPEDVAKYLLDREFAWPPRVRKALEAAIKHAWFPYHSHMGTRFETTRGPLSALKVAGDLFPALEGPADGNDLDAVETYLGALNAALGRVPGDDFKSRPAKKDRPKEWRHHGAFNKRWRLAIHLERKLAKRQAHSALTKLARVAKSRLAHEIAWDDFSDDALTAAFIAYFTATLNRRSVFTAGKQKRAFDAVASALFDALDAKTANWWAVAHVYPDQSVLSRLSEEHRGALLGRWYGVMEASADILGQLAWSGGYDLKTLVVRPGNDSSTWNAAAGAYNKARDGWVNALYELGAAEVLDRFVPTKAMRLMAADVVRMHRMWGSGDLDPQTRVWQLLPKPWDILAGKATCTRDQVEAACLEAGVPADGWVRPRPKTVAAFSPTPELVHGVSVASPELAAQLKKAGYYCGPSKAKKAVQA